MLDPTLLHAHIASHFPLSTNSSLGEKKALNPKTTRNKDAIRAPGLTTRNKDASRNKCIATSNKCLTSSNKKLLVTSALLVVSRTLVGNVAPSPAARCRAPGPHSSAQSRRS